MSKDPRVYLAHILECIQKIERFTAGGRGAFLTDELVQDAVLRNFEVIGEAAKLDAAIASSTLLPLGEGPGMRVEHPRCSMKELGYGT